MSVRERTNSSVKERTKLKRPSRWGVKFYNDDITSYEEVMIILMSVFQLKSQEAFNFARSVDKNGYGIVGNYSKEMAEAKKEEVEKLIGLIKKPLKVEIVKIEEDN